MQRRTFVVLSLCAMFAGAYAIAATNAPDGVRIVTTSKSKRAMDDAQAIADLARTAAEQILGTGVTRNAYVVTLYPTLAEYQAKDKELAEGKFANNWAFSAWGTKESYLAMMPPMDDALLDAVGLTSLMRSQIAHEVGHQIMFNTVPAYRSLPDWLGEGLACAVELEAMRAAKLVDDLGQAPFYARRIVLARAMFENKTWPTAARILADDYGSLEASDRYAIWSLFVGWLFDGEFKKNRRALLGELRKVAATAPEAKQKITAIFIKALGKRVAKLDAEFEAYLDTLRPEWNETFRANESRDGELLTLAFETSDARCTRVEAVGEAAYTLSGTLEFLTCGSGELHLFVAASSASNPESGLMVRFTRDHGVSAVWAPGPNDGEPGFCSQRLPTDRPAQFTVRVEPNQIVIAIEGEDVVTVPTETPADGGRFAIGAKAGSGGWWRDLTVTPTK